MTRKFSSEHALNVLGVIIFAIIICVGITLGLYLPYGIGYLYDHFLNLDYNWLLKWLLGAGTILMIVIVMKVIQCLYCAFMALVDYIFPEEKEGEKDE